MIVRQLDDNHDWTFGHGLGNYLDSSEAIAQCVKTKLLALKRDWFLNREDGIFNVDGVVHIDSFDIL